MCPINVILNKQKCETLRNQLPCDHHYQTFTSDLEHTNNTPTAFQNSKRIAIEVSEQQSTYDDQRFQYKSQRKLNTRTQF